MQTHPETQREFFPSSLTDVHFVSADLLELFPRPCHTDELCRLRRFTVTQHEYTPSQSASRRESENCEYLRAPRSVNPETVRDTKCLLRSQPCCLLRQQSVPVVDILLSPQEATNSLCCS